ncbi:PDDEXK nuclease domain-containing protein [Achromobacter sp.]|uniref:PDDEXK nuclease domain-containing protein n=1 Tax=Achromobacter sp. TaxID=134375 RepID=UPI003C72538C
MIWKSAAWCGLTVKPGGISKPMSEEAYRLLDARTQGRWRAACWYARHPSPNDDRHCQLGCADQLWSYWMLRANNLESMRRFFLACPQPEISQTLTGKLGNEPPAEKSQTVSGKLSLSELAQVFTLPWSAYVRLLAVKDDHARRFYEAEALRGGWSVRQLDRLIGSQFYERTALSKDKAAMLLKGSVAKPEDAVTPNDAIKDPYVLEFLDLKDEYSESDLEAALIQRLEDFLLELGEGFTFVGRQRPLRIDQTWYRVDLLFFHRKLRCLVIIDLKLGSLTHADAGQMHMYCNYAKEHWAYPDENPPVGLILCADKGHALARYALDGLPTKVMAANYRTVLPDAELLQKELEDTRRLLESRALKKPEQSRR